MLIHSLCHVLSKVLSTSKTSNPVVLCLRIPSAAISIMRRSCCSTEYLPLNLNCSDGSISLDFAFYCFVGSVLLISTGLSFPSDRFVLMPDALRLFHYFCLLIHSVHFYKEMIIIEAPTALGALLEFLCFLFCIGDMSKGEINDNWLEIWLLI